MPNQVEQIGVLSPAREVTRSRITKSARILGMLGGLWGVGITFALLFLPIVQFCQSIITTSGQEFNGGLSKTLIESQGGQLEPVTWIYLAVMPILSLIALALAWRIRLAGRAKPLVLLCVGILLGIGAAIAGFSIGLFYIPGAISILIAAVLAVIS